MKFYIFLENLKSHYFSQSKLFIKIPKIKFPFKYFIQTNYFIMNHFKFLEKINSSTKLFHPNTLLVDIDDKHKALGTRRQHRNFCIGGDFFKTVRKKEVKLY